MSLFVASRAGRRACGTPRNSEGRHGGGRRGFGRPWVVASPV